MAVNHAVSRILNKATNQQMMLAWSAWRDVQACWACSSCKWSPHASEFELFSCAGLRCCERERGAGWSCCETEGLRPSLPMMRHTVDSFFALALPRKHEVCSNMSEHTWAGILFFFMLLASQGHLLCTTTRRLQKHKAKCSLKPM